MFMASRYPNKKSAARKGFGLAKVSKNQSLKLLSRKNKNY